MIYDSMTDIINKVSSRYLLVNIISRRARIIQEKAEAEDEILYKKPVSYAIQEIAEGTLEFEVKQQ